MSARLPAVIAWSCIQGAENERSRYPSGGGRISPPSVRSTRESQQTAGQRHHPPLCDSRAAGTANPHIDSRYTATLETLAAGA